MPRRNVGISGVAVTAGALGVWFVYAGIKNVDPVAGLASLLRGEIPPSRTPGDPYAGAREIGDTGTGGTGTSAGGAGGDLGLVGNAAKALPVIRAAAGTGITITGRAERPNNPNSDHPKGLAVDVMTRDGKVAGKVIAAFKRTTGAHYWIWNGQLGDMDRLWVPYKYTKFGGHYDHVHLSWR